MATVEAIAREADSYVVATGREAWNKASIAERARRMEERGMKHMKAGAMWQWQEAGKVEEQRRTRIARAWRRHREKEDWEERLEERERERARKGKRRVNRRLTPQTEERSGRKKGKRQGGEGWTVAGALIRYKKGELRERRNEETTEAMKQARELQESMIRALRRTLLEAVAEQAVREYHGLTEEGEGEEGAGTGTQEAAEVTEVADEEGSEGDVIHVAQGSMGAQ